MTGLYIVIADVVDAEGHPEAMREVDGETLLSHHVHAAQLARLSGPLCITGPEADRVEAEHEAFPIQFVRGAGPTRLQSLLAVLAGVPRENAAFITPIERRPPRVDTFDLLAEALEQASPGHRVIRPVMRGQAGFPLVLLPAGIRSLQENPSANTLREWAAGVAARGGALDVPVDDYHVLPRE